MARLRYLVLGLLAVLAAVAVAWAQGTGVNPPVGSVWTYLGATYGAGWAPATTPAYGVDARDFGLNTQDDAGPPIRAAYAQALHLGVPLLLRPAGAIYTIKSVDPAAYNATTNGNGPYPNTLQPGVYFGSQAGTTSNVAIDFGGVTLQMAGTGCTLPSGYGNDCRRTETLMFDNIHNLSVSGGLTLLGQNLGPSGGSTLICPLALFNLVGFNIGAINFISMGGAGGAFCGDWLVHGRISDAYAPGIGGVLADMSFLNDVIFDHWLARPGDTGGNYAHQGTGISVIYDVPNAGVNKTGFPYTSTTHLTLMNSDIAGFDTGFYISEGSYVKSINNYYHDSTGGTTHGAIGLLVHNNDSIASGGVHPFNIVSSGDVFSGNGNATYGGADFALAWNPGISTGALIWVTLLGGTFQNPVGGIADQISAQTAHHQNLLVTGNSGLSAGKINISNITPQSDWIFANRDVNSGILNPALPSGTGAGNTTVNAEPYPVQVRLTMGASPGTVCAVPRGLAALCDGVNTGPNMSTSLMLNPGDGVYFTGAVPVGWSWVALGG